MFLYALILCLSMDISFGHRYLPGEEPSCLSSFNYEYKVIQKLVQLEEGQDKMSQTIQSQREQITAADERQEKMVQTMQTQREQIAAADERQEKLTETMQTQREQITALETNAEDATETVTALQRDILKVGRYPNGGGSTYIRWGRTSCPGNGTELVYPGYAGGSSHAHKGAAASYLCLPQNPLWGKYDDTLNSYGMIYGAEYEYTGKLFSSIKDYTDDVPCAVCRSPRPSLLMIPARNACYGNWTLEYYGYLMAGYHDHAAASDYVCVDKQPEAIEGGSANKQGKLFYQVEGRCGSLKCPPYVNGREITCAVCTK